MELTTVLLVWLKNDPRGHVRRASGKVRGRLGRPGAESHKLDLARQELAKGTGIGKTARLVGLGTGTVHKLKREMVTS